MKQNLIIIIAIVILAKLFSGKLEASEGQFFWPQWRGPTWNGVAIKADPPVTWDATKNVSWKVPVEGSGWGTPIVWDDRIFLLAAVAVDKKMPVPDVIPKGTPNINLHPQVIRSWKPQKFLILCIDRTNGSLLWRRIVLEAMPHQGHHRKGGFASASPVTDGKYIYAYFGSFGLYCYDVEGRFVWEKNFEPQAMEDSLGEGSSPAIYGDKLIIVVDHELQSYVVAIDKRTGKEIWKSDRDEISNWSTPRVYTHDDRRKVVVNGEIVRSYDLVTGELVWKCGGHTASAIPMPAVGHGLVFTASGWKKDALQAIALGQRGDLTNSESVVWSLHRGVPYVPCPMLWGEEIYLLDDHSFFSCLHAVDGKPYYLKHRLPGNLNFSASPVGASDRIYLLSEEGTTIVLKRGYNVNVIAMNKLNEKCYASPAIVGNAIYLRSNKHLFCIKE